MRKLAPVLIATALLAGVSSEAAPCDKPQAILDSAFERYQDFWVSRGVDATDVELDMLDEDDAGACLNGKLANACFVPEEHGGPTIEFTQKFLDFLAETYGDEVDGVIDFIVGHEFGHVTSQEIETTRPRREAIADCLSGYAMQALAPEHKSEAIAYLSDLEPSGVNGTADSRIHYFEEGVQGDDCRSIEVIVGLGG